MEAVAEIKGVRHSELKSISERLAAISEISRARKWESRAQLLAAAAVGGGVGFVPFLAEKPSKAAAIVYVAVVFIAGAASRLFSQAATDVRAERSDSINAIKGYIDNTMLKTDVPRLQAPATARRLGPEVSSPAAPVTPPQAQAAPSQQDPLGGG